MSVQKSKYRYRSLNERGQGIRLLRLRPELDADGLIQCDIYTYDIATAPTYQALSYEWGPPEEFQRLSVGGRFLSIRRNLWLFLEMFRSNANNDTPLWIDQICIDQQNISERGHQVKLMGNIYTRATRAVVWLGTSTGVNTDLSTTFSRHGDLLLLLRGDRRVREEDQVPIVTDNVVKDAEMTAPRPWSEQQCTEDRCALCCWHQKRLGRRERDLDKASNERPMLNDISDLTYWARLWIIQENVLARNCLFFLGELQYSRSEIRRYAKLQRIVSAPQLTASYPRTIAHILLLTRNDRSDSNMSLERAFQHYGDHDHGVQYSDARDLVYGLLGLVKPRDRFVVDYRLSSMAVFDCLMNKIILSPTLCVSSRGVSPLLSPNLAHIGKTLGLTASWARWLATTGPEQSLCDSIEEFLYCLNLLERLGFQKKRWTPFELGSIVHAARKMEHTLLPPRSWHPNEMDQGSLPPETAQCVRFIEDVDGVVGTDLPCLLLNMESSPVALDVEKSLLTWTGVFHRLMR